MVRHFVTRAAVVLALLFILMLLSAPVALADNCSSLSDCLPMTDAQTAVTVAVAVLVAVALFALPQLLHTPTGTDETPLDSAAPPEAPGAAYPPPDPHLAAGGYPPVPAHGAPGYPGAQPQLEGHPAPWQGQDAYRGDQAAFAPQGPQGSYPPGYHAGAQQGLPGAHAEAQAPYQGPQAGHVEAQGPYAQQQGPEVAHFEAREPGAAHVGEQMQQGPGAEHLANHPAQPHSGMQENRPAGEAPAEGKQIDHAPSAIAHRQNHPPGEIVERSGPGQAAPAGGEPQIGRPESEVQLMRQGEAPQIARGDEGVQPVPFVPPLEQAPPTVPLAGLHHITASTSDLRRNLICYTRVLGLRLLKVTVDVDHPDTYQLYYGDAVGTPGSVISFVCWPNAPRGSRGTGQAISIAFAIPPGTLSFWAEYLTRQGITLGGPSARFGDQMLSFFDPDGVQIDLVEHNGALAREGWSSERIPPECTIRGLHSVSLSVNDATHSAALLQQALGFRKLGEAGSRHRLGVGEGGPGTLLDLIHLPSVPAGTNGSGIIQRVSWSTPNEAQQLTWQYALALKQVQVSQVIDHYYYRALLFQLPGGALFEIATDVPGFTVDERPFELGTHLMLPPWLEAQRDALLRVLPPLELPARE